MSKNIALLFLLSFSLLLFSACDTGFKRLFSKQTPREKYIDQLKKRSSESSVAWEATAKFALRNPVNIPAPYAENGYFSGKFTDAVAFRFSAKAGQAVNIKLQQTGNPALTTFTDLWDANDTSALELLESADTTLNKISHNSTRDQDYIFRMQPAAADSGRYELTITLAPMLDFPIAADTKSNIGSLWGVDRDAGARRHEGIDIFAKKGSNAVAVADGYISRTGETNLGGKVVWLRPSQQNFSVYYAHLDSQLVSPGQFVKAGQPVGFVGNTGNARHAPAHLHFGIYTRNGAVNPLAFVQQVDIPGKLANRSLNETYSVTGKTNFYRAPVKKENFALVSAGNVRTEAYTGAYLRVILPDSTRAFIPPASLTSKMKL